VTFVDSATADLLPAGLYSAYHAVYPGFNSSTNSWAATDSRSTPLSDGIFQVLQVREFNPLSCYWCKPLQLTRSLPFCSRLGRAGMLGWRQHASMVSQRL
jgi:hypothetical protein